MVDLREQLVEMFGLEEFRPAQREVIEEGLAGGDGLCVMPTGAGESLCYQLAARVGGGLGVVGGALISLVQDEGRWLEEGVGSGETGAGKEGVRWEIVERLGLRKPTIFITGFDRPNLRYESRSVAKVKEKDAELIRLVKKEQGSGIVYCATRKTVE